MNDSNTTRMPIAQLKPHPLQPAFYADGSAEDDKALAADLRLRGQLDPIIVMPADNAAGLPVGTILDGHRRARLLAQIGVLEAIVLVRDDLKGANAQTVEAEFLRYNFLRRQLHPIDKARVARRLMELEEKSPVSSFGYPEYSELRDRVGQALGMGGRNLSRYLRLLTTPLAVQSAVRDGHLKLVDGGHVAALSAEKQLEVADRLEKLADKSQAAQVVAEYLEASGNHRRNANKALAALIRGLDQGLPDMKAWQKEVSPALVCKEISTLRKARRLFDQLIRWAPQKKKQQDRAVQQLLEGLSDVKSGSEFG